MPLTYQYLLPVAGTKFVPVISGLQNTSQLKLYNNSKCILSSSLQQYKYQHNTLKLGLNSYKLCDIHQHYFYNSLQGLNFINTKLTDKNASISAEKEK